METRLCQANVSCDVHLTCGCDGRAHRAGGVQHSAQTPEDERGLWAGRQLEEELRLQRFVRPR